MANETTAAEWLATSKSLREQQAQVAKEAEQLSLESVAISKSMNDLFRQASLTSDPVLQNKLLAERQALRVEKEKTDSKVAQLAEQETQLKTQAYNAEAKYTEAQGGPPALNSTTPPGNYAATVENPPQPEPVVTPTVEPRPTPPNLTVVQTPIGNGEISYNILDVDRGVQTRSFSSAEEANAYIASTGANGVSPAVPASQTPTPSTTSPAAVPSDGTPAAGTPAATATTPTPLTPQTVNPVAYDDDGNLMPGFELDENNNPVFVGNGTAPTVYSPTPVPPSKAGPVGTPYDDDGNLNPGWTLDENNNPVYVGGTFVEPATAASAAASREAATKLKAKEQAVLAARYRTSANNDWRVRLSLAPNSQYLYNNPDAGILAPLKASKGVIFPYTPTVATTYSANYEAYDLIHSNYRGLYYKNSRVGDISIRGMFTAQDTAEAQYLLAVIHFFRSVTKMFYGQDPERGTPPPLVYLSGFGEYQFNGHACVVNSFNYTLPNDVDYIKANNPNNYGTSLFNRRTPTQSGFGGTSFAGALRLANALLPKGAQPAAPKGNAISQSVNNTADSTYVPTKMEIDISLIPVQTRSQVSKVFSLKEFANGNQLKGGFW